METYDPAKIGRTLSWGRSHWVYRYGDDEVIKIPLLEKLIWPQLKERLERDHAVCRRYLGEYFLDTRIVAHPLTAQIAMIQPRLDGFYLRKSDLEDPQVRKQFDDFIARHEALVCDGNAPVELIGHRGYRRWLSNVFVTHDKRLRVVDANLLDTMGGVWGIPFWKVLIRLVIKRQNSTIGYLRA